MLHTTNTIRNHEGFITLVIRIIQSGIDEEGPGYLDTEGGRHWLNVLDIDVDQFIDYVRRSFKRAS